MRTTVIMILMVWTAMLASARNVTINVIDHDAADLFATLMAQTGKNFVYHADLLKGLRVTVNADDEPLGNVLDRMFESTPVAWHMRGNNIFLTRRDLQRHIVVSGYVREASTGESLIGALVSDASGRTLAATNAAGFYSIEIVPGPLEFSVTYPGFVTGNVSRRVDRNTRINIALRQLTIDDVHQLDEVVVTADRNNAIAMETTDVGRLNLTRGDIVSTPVIFGEADVIKTLQLQPGVSAGTEGLAGMYVHGGNNDENLYMLDNIPLYQINHFGGLFSAFNTEAVKNVDFYKSTFPAKYDGRLSSIMEVHTKDGSESDHSGSFRIGLTSGAFNIDGPLVKDRTTYSLAVRRSWFDVLSVPALAIYNSAREDESSSTIAHYAFTDVNAKITHRFNSRTRMHFMFYYGEDYLKGGSKSRDVDDEGDVGLRRDIARLRWGNLVVAVGCSHEFSSRLFGEFTAAYTHYRSRLKRESARVEIVGGEHYGSERHHTTSNSISDFMLRADMTWNAASVHRVDFGAASTHHDFMPLEISNLMVNNGSGTVSATFSQRISANEASVYVADDWSLTPTVRITAGFNAGMFHISGKSNYHLDPRLSARWRINDRWTVKAAYARMSQYVHQLTESSISLPTDRWIPIAGDMKPQTSDKVSAGGYLDFGHGCVASAEIYLKHSHNIIDYRDDYYLAPNDAPWHQVLCVGSGRAKGIDLSLSKRAGAVTGHVAWSLLWADCLFANRNGGRRFPSRYDNRHKINVMVNWRINDKWSLNASWTGMTGNRFTLSLQDYELLDAPSVPDYMIPEHTGILDLNEGVNNMRLPFYHRLDVGVNRYTRNGMWNFSLYNAYCNLNVIALRKNRDNYPDPDQFEKLRLIPIIPSVSYTWFF